MEQTAGISRAIAQVRLAQSTWQAVRVKDRSNRIARFAGLVVEQRRRLSEGILYPTRSGYLETITSELLPLAETGKWLSSNAARVLRARKTSRLSTPMWLGSQSSRIERVPRGVVLILGTWNYPIFLTGSQMLHALVAGNAVVIKPAPGCESVTQQLASMCVECGIPADLIWVLESSIQAGQQAMEVGVDHVVMTGSSRSGRRVIEQSIPSLCSSTLELSGSDAVFVLPSADLKRVTSLLRFGLRLNGGATCIAPRRVFVIETMLDRFNTMLKDKINQPSGSQWSSWITSGTYDQLQPLVQKALDQGATMLTDWYCDPQSHQTLSYPTGQSNWLATGQIVLSGVTPNMDLYGLDVFAPLLTVVPVRDIDQAIEYNRQCRYGLCASVFGSESQAAMLAPRIQAGSILLNDFVVPTADPRLPFGGRGESGYGVTRGEEGLLEMTIPQVISTKRGKWLPHSDLPHPKDEQLLDGLLQFRHGKDWKLRLDGLKQIFGAIRRNPN